MGVQNFFYYTICILYYTILLFFYYTWAKIMLHRKIKLPAGVYAYTILLCDILLNSAPFVVVTSWHVSLLARAVHHRYSYFSL